MVAARSDRPTTTSAAPAVDCSQRRIVAVVVTSCRLHARPRPLYRLTGCSSTWTAGSVRRELAVAHRGFTARPIQHHIPADAGALRMREGEPSQDPVACSALRMRLSTRRRPVTNPPLLLEACGAQRVGWQATVGCTAPAGVWLADALTEAAWAAIRTEDTYLQASCRRVAGPAPTPTARPGCGPSHPHKIVIAAYS